MRHRSRPILALMLAVLPAFAQSYYRQPSLIVDLGEDGQVRAWLSLPQPASPQVSEAFARVMGCPPDPDLADRPSTSLHLECGSPLKRDGLQWSARWDFSALSNELSAMGLTSLDVSLHHPRAGSSRLDPAVIPQKESAGFRVSYYGQIRLNDFHELTLRTGYGTRQIELLAGVATLIMLLPLLLFATRSGGPLTALAGATGLFWVAATAWLCVIPPLNLAALAPLPWNVATVSAPMLMAVWIGSHVAGGPRQKSVFWRGVRGVSFLTLIVALFNAVNSVLPWAAFCLVGILLSFWRLQRAGGHGLQPLTDATLLARIRELAGRAGAPVKSVQLLLGGEEVPAAFASRTRGILLTPKLLATLSRRETDAVIAHELSHVRNPRTALLRGGAFLLPICVGVAFLMPLSLQWLPLLLPPAFLTYRALRRWNERRADGDAVIWSGDPEALITALTRVTHAHGMPLEWPGWVKPLMPHPSTMDRIRTVAQRAHIPEPRFAELLAETTTAPADGYGLPATATGGGTVFTPLERARLRTRLSLVTLALPVAFGVAAPFLGYLAAFLIGAVTLCLATEWVLLRARSRGRAQLAGRPGVFTGFSPSLEPRVYDGSSDFDWGFAAFEGSHLVFRGDRRSFKVSREEIAQIWLDRGPFSWLPRPSVCFRLQSGEAFGLRPFDRAFGPAAPRAAARLLRQAREWHAGAPPAQATAGDFDFTSVTGQVPPAYTWRLLLRALPRYGAITLALSWLFIATGPVSAWTDLARIFGPVAVTWALLVFIACPSLLRRPQVRPA